MASLLIIWCIWLPSACQQYCNFVLNVFLPMEERKEGNEELKASLRNLVAWVFSAKCWKGSLHHCDENGSFQWVFENRMASMMFWCFVWIDFKKKWKRCSTQRSSVTMETSNLVKASTHPASPHPTPPQASQSLQKTRGKLNEISPSVQPLNSHQHRHLLELPNLNHSN